MAEGVLTPQEWRIAALVAEGLNNAEIATVLGITPRTVGTHLRHIYLKLHLRNRVMLAVWYAQQTPGPEGGPVG